MAQTKITLVIIVLGFLVGWQVQGWRMGEQLASVRQAHADALVLADTERREKEAVLRTKNKAVTDAVIATRANRDTVTEYVTKEVIRYVQDPDAGQCVMPAHGVRILNAATPAVPGAAAPASGADAADAAVSQP